MRVLLIEDDSPTAKSIESILNFVGFTIDVVQMGYDGIEIGKIYDYDAIILDLMLPDIDGFEVIKTLRGANILTPVIILSGIETSVSKVRGLDIGADDYITKPFEKAELVSRIQAVIRRSKGHAESLIKIGRLSVNLQTHMVYVDDQQLHLTGKEYAILELLCLRKGSTLTKEMFLNHLYGGIDEPELKIVDVFICKLRRKLEAALGEDTYIETVWGRGYSISDPFTRNIQVVANKNKQVEDLSNLLHIESRG